MNLNSNLRNASEKKLYLHRNYFIVIQKVSAAPMSWIS